MTEPSAKSSLSDAPVQAGEAEEQKDREEPNSDSEDAEEGGSVLDSEDDIENEDEEALPLAVPVVKKRQSFGLRAKKFVASKTAQTKLGRKVSLSSRASFYFL